MVTAGIGRASGSCPITARSRPASASSNAATSTTAAPGGQDSAGSRRYQPRVAKKVRTPITSATSGEVTDPGERSRRSAPRSGRSVTPSRPSPASRSAAARSPRRASGSTASHGTSTKARSAARGCGSVSAGSSLRTSTPPSVTVTTSTSSVRGPQRTSRVRPGPPFGLVGAGEPVTGGGGRVVDHEHGVEEVRLLDRPPRRGLDDAGGRDQPRPDHVDGGAQVARAGRRGWSRSTARRGSLAGRARSIVTATSANVSGIGACGLWTVTRARSTRASARQTAARRAASVSSRSTGSPATTAASASASSP